MWTDENRARYDRTGLRYPSDLTDDEWALVEPLLPPQRRVCRRQIVAGLMYVLTTGCQWRQVPKDLPAKSTLHDYLLDWHADGTLAKIHLALYTKARELAERNPTPTLAIVDSQSVKSAEKGGRILIRSDMTQARKLKARNGTRRWIRSAC